MQRRVDRMTSLLDARIIGTDESGWARLADAGFYRSNENFAKNRPADLVRCFYCMMEKGNWCKTDNPIDVHLRLSPNCQWRKYDITSCEGCCIATVAECELIREKQSLIYDRCVHMGIRENVYPFPQYFMSYIKNSVMWTYGSDVDIKSRPQLVPLILSEESIDRDDMIRLLDWEVDHNNLFKLAFNTLTNRRIWWHVNETYVEEEGEDTDIYFVDLDSAACRKNCRDDMCILANRIGTFDNESCPYLQKNAERVASAGFYRDIVSCRCFFCGVNVESWKEGDDPDHVHAIKSNGCKFVRSKLTNSKIESILYHYYKNEIMKNINQNYRRHVLETIIDNQSGSRDEAVVKLCILGSLDNMPDVVELVRCFMNTAICGFTITDVVNEFFHMHPTDECDKYRTTKMYTTTPEVLKDLLLLRSHGLHASCGCPEPEPEPEFDEPSEFDDQIKLPCLKSDARPPSIMRLMNLCISRREPAKILPHSPKSSSD